MHSSLQIAILYQAIYQLSRLEHVRRPNQSFFQEGSCLFFTHSHSHSFSLSFKKRCNSFFFFLFLSFLTITEQHSFLMTFCILYKIHNIQFWNIFHWLSLSVSMVICVYDCLLNMFCFTYLSFYTNSLYYFMVLL